MGIELSSALDTISRQPILNFPVYIRCTQDEVTLVCVLFSNTKLRIRVGKSQSSLFLSPSRAFQVVSLSGSLSHTSLSCTIISKLFSGRFGFPGFAAD